MFAFARNLPMTDFRFDLKLCHVCFGMFLSLCDPSYRSCRYILYRVTTYEHYIALDMCEVLSVNFLQTLNYLIKVRQEVKNIKGFTKVSSE